MKYLGKATIINGATVSQDHSVYRWGNADIVFDIYESSVTRLKCVATGYGQTGVAGGYGNGAIYVDRASVRWVEREGIIMKKDNKVDGRYPYTYACDYIRSLAGYNSAGTKLERSDASTIRSGIAQAIGMDDDELAIKLADYFKANEEEITKKSVEQFMEIMK